MDKKRAAHNIISFLLGNGCFYLCYKLTHKEEQQGRKHKKYMQLLDRWLTIYERGERIEKYFDGKGIREVAVYGYGNIGRHLVTQLINSHIKVRYVIDKRNIVPEYAVDKYKPTDKLPEVEAIVVTPIEEYEKIKNELGVRIACKFISVEDIIYELL